jgi:hypothetical protein
MFHKGAHPHISSIFPRENGSGERTTRAPVLRAIRVSPSLAFGRDARAFLSSTRTGTPPARVTA